MSITSVSKQIKTAMRDALITAVEANKIVANAERGPVTVGEARVIRELFEKAPQPVPPGRMVTLMIPENPGDILFQPKATSAIEAFFSRNNVPAGANAKKTIAKIEAKLDRDGPGTELARAPNTKKLHMVRLPYPELMVDYPSRTAFVDSRNNEFYLVVSGGLMAPGPHNTHWYGPVKMDVEAAPDTITDLRKGELLEVFNRLNIAGTLNWQPGGVIDNAPVGAKFVTVPLFSERHPEGYSYSALIPVGSPSTGANKDPNKVGEFYVEKSGGFGLTWHVGPLTATVLPGLGGHGPRDRGDD